MFRFSVILFFARLRINACWSKCFRYFFSYSFMVRLAFLRWWYIIRGVNVLLFFFVFILVLASLPHVCCGKSAWSSLLEFEPSDARMCRENPASFPRVRKQGRFETPFPFPMVSSKPFASTRGCLTVDFFLGFLWPCFWVAFFWDFSCWRFKGRYFPLVDAIFFANPIIQSVI